MTAVQDREKFAHILRRFGLGASEAELDFYLEDGYEQGIEKLLAYEAIPEAFDYDISRFANEQRFLPIQGVKAHVYQYLLTTQRPLEAKLSLFWHDHFATSAVKVEIPKAMHTHWETLRENCSGKFSVLLEKVTKDPAMLYWLDNHENVAGSPNENFARELFELFTLGIGNYTEDDVAETARAFTGYTFVRVPEPDAPVAGPRYDFIFRPRLHDSGEKSLLGRSGRLNGDDVLRIAVAKEQTSKYIAKKFWEYFVYLDPSDSIVDRLAAAWRSSDLNIKELVRTIIRHPEFFGEKAMRSHVKNPVEFCISIGRQVGIGASMLDYVRGTGIQGNRQLFAIIQNYGNACRSMGMDLLSPPDVDGWPLGDNWISSATMIERIKFADNVFTLGQGRIPIVPVEGVFTPEMTPREISERLVSIFDAHVPDSKIDAMAESIESEARGGLTATNYGGILSKASSILFGMPEFQLH